MMGASAVLNTAGFSDVALSVIFTLSPSARHPDLHAELSKARCSDPKGRMGMTGGENECGAPPASPRRCPASPVNGAGGTTGCRDDSRAQESFLAIGKFFRASHFDFAVN